MSFFSKSILTSISLKSCLNFSDFRLKIAQNNTHLGEFAKKSMEKCQNNDFFKQQVISEPQRLCHFSRAYFMQWILKQGCFSNF